MTTEQDKEWLTKSPEYGKITLVPIFREDLMVSLKSRVYTKKDVWCRPVSDIQKPGCIKSGCYQKAVNEAVINYAGNQTAVRCCENKECYDFAAELALLSANLAPGSP